MTLLEAPPCWPKPRYGWHPCHHPQAGVSVLSVAGPGYDDDTETITLNALLAVAPAEETPPARRSRRILVVAAVAALASGGVLAFTLTREPRGPEAAIPAVTPAPATDTPDTAATAAPATRTPEETSRPTPRPTATRTPAPGAREPQLDRERKPGRASQAPKPHGPKRDKPRGRDTGWDDVLDLDPVLGGRSRG